MDDTILNILYIEQVFNDSPLLSHLPAHDVWNVWIVVIGYEDLIMDDFAADRLLRNQKRSRTNTISTYLTQKNSPWSNIQEIWADFDQS